MTFSDGGDNRCSCNRQISCEYILFTNFSIWVILLTMPTLIVSMI